MIHNDIKYDIVMFNMSSMYDWDHGIVNRNYNVVNTLEKREDIHRIISVDFLPIGIKKAIGHYFKNILWEIKNAEMIYGDLTSVCYQKSEKLFVYSTIDSIFSLKTVVRELKRIEKVLNLQNVIFWSYNTLFIDFIGKLNEKLFVFDTVDNWSEHPEYLKLKPKVKILQNYQTIADKANLIFTVSNSLVDFYSALNRSKDIYWIPNGVDYDFFNNENMADQQTKLDNCQGPIIGYLGTIEERFDIDLLVEVAKANTEKTIAICGPVWDGVKKQMQNKTRNLENIIFTGRIDYKLAPAYLNKFDVAIMPHKVNDFVKSMNPMKMYEYLACGKPIVSTKVAGIEQFDDLIYSSNDTVEFINLITKALAEDNLDKQQKRRQASKNCSWDKRVQIMVDLIKTKLS
ncbi:hypothetical protein A2533_03510 [Candidatus Falkowbacteria bacterium RIFOXYD2_FULL_35_9]|uniref:Glycosyl transferase family 1 domain-containing protein n=1 Tax=Candidatus Falkowbacteria bacterium RIFOXYC2_FULL_36_12 TaxID=1798002 RepID=A0A1F5T0E5_9BACT|nr:MAG: hypothetical protein A2300_01430 [Candidatus Falkowbacteria bacterium RIFOXYB2_FULL_35_7]OGF32418.1 MAG: hypothetical protein A2478_03805 [Candidatus Falkowbacteria bacterium RIFOXYC2_FULL_36_12]OGF33865.1 MAG: hypothetical protein A2223_03040 [Candidatus Falkowbacteria bacterium RIFOXYA2_FULL_35_8]OGF47375.1 MAG: hypothetical protein A2533_03510 [Candidatus Falkowbacteria bacterium RIFOXYD2_FULL_35_9]